MSRKKKILLILAGLVVMGGAAIAVITYSVSVYVERRVEHFRRLAEYGMTADFGMGLSSLKAPSVTAHGLIPPLGCPFDRRGLPNLKSVPKLRSVDLSYVSISDDDLRHLAELQHLEYLDLRGSQLTDVGLAHLGGLRNLTTLFLDESGIGDKEIAVLAKLPKLAILSVSFTRISNASLQTLSNHAALQELRVLGTEVSVTNTIRFRVYGAPPPKPPVPFGMEDICGEWCSPGGHNLQRIRFSDSTRSTDSSYELPADTYHCGVDLRGAGPTHLYSVDMERSALVIRNLSSGCPVGVGYLQPDGRIWIEMFSSQRSGENQFERVFESLHLTRN